MIETRTRRVWFSPTARRHYFSKWAACIGEARARIKKKHPSDEGEYENGYCISPAWNWTELPRSEVLLKRYARLIMRGTTNPAEPSERKI